MKCHTTHLTQRQQLLLLASRRFARSGEGIFGWRKVYQRVEYRLAKERPMTVCEHGCLWVHSQ